MTKAEVYALVKERIGFVASCDAVLYLENRKLPALDLEGLQRAIETTTCMPGDPELHVIDLTEEETVELFAEYGRGLGEGLAASIFEARRAAASSPRLTVLNSDLGRVDA